MRTPLTSVRGLLSMLHDGDFGALKPAQQRAVDNALASSSHMVNLINDLLSISRIQTDKFELQMAPTNLGDILRIEIQQLKTFAMSHRVQLQINVDPDLPEITCDANKIRQVMMNFIDNAVYYSPPNSTVQIDLYGTRGQIYFTVNDHGIGVPEAEQKSLFSRFFRASNARQARPDGTGIGLYVARKVIAAHHGTLIFYSQQNMGSEFGFRLRLNKLNQA
jgi:signal transduction histidine kinase